MDLQSFNRVSIDLDALCCNFRLLRERAGRAAFMAVVKADAYGHGMIECAKALEAEGCGIFGVAELREAVLLRDAGIKGRIFCLVGFDLHDAGAILEYELTPVVYDLESLKALSEASRQSGKTIDVHLKVEVGMNRLGIQPDQCETVIATFKELPGIRLAGIAGHFPCADDPESSSTLEGLGRLREFERKLEPLGPFISHVSNSAATLNFSETHNDMVRCGISLYGYHPAGPSFKDRIGLKPVMSFSSRVVQVKRISPRAGVSYGHTFYTERETILAVIPVGYEHGYSRKFSNRGEVLIRGQRAPICGRVCMDLCMVDVTDIQGVRAGDPVILIGTDGEASLTADDLAGWAETISYEVLCQIGNSNQREFS